MESSYMREASSNVIKKNIKTVVDDRVRELLEIPEGGFTKDHGALLKQLTDCMKALTDIPDEVEPDWTAEAPEEDLLKEFE